MLLVHPLSELLRLLPVLVLSVVVGSQSGNHLWGLVAVVVLVGIGIARYFTTTYRIGPVHVQLRRGVFSKRELSIPRNRIRSVDVRATVLHRLLGLSVLTIGTGRRADDTDDNATFELNALANDLVAPLRSALLAREPAPRADGDAPPAADGEAPVAAPPQGVEIGHWRPSWVRFAPFSVAGIVTVAAIVGLVFQYGVGEQLVRLSDLGDRAATLARAGIAISVVLAVVALLVVSSVLACVLYLVRFGNLRVVDDGRTIEVSHGLLETRQTTLDRRRLRGATLQLPLLLRAVGGAALSAIMTGVSAEKRQSSMLLPQSPRREAQRVMVDVIGDDRQVAAVLTPHGPRAARRRFTRALAPGLLVLVGGAGWGLFVSAPPWWVWTVAAVLVVGGALLAWDRYRGLGHAVLPGWLVTQHGSLDRRRHSLEAAGIIGWTVRQTFFQRRLGLATIVAATPAGTGHYEVIDIPVADAWALVDAVTPGAGDVWATRP
nr:PH domain-containing protein [Rhodococcus rhodnii]